MDVPEVARRQRGLFTYRQARAAGWSAARIRRLLAAGRWVVVVRGVLCAAITLRDRTTRLRAAHLATGGVVSHQSAALVWGLMVPDDGQLHVTVPRSVRGRHPDVVVHRLDLDPTDVALRDGLPITGRIRTVIDCLATLPEPHARRLLDQVLLQRWLDLDLLTGRVRGAVGRRGTPQLVRLVRIAAGGSRSEAERLLHLILRRNRIRGWQANVQVRDHAGLVGIVDVLFHDVRLVLEVDGRAWHVDADRFQRDRSRQNRLVGAGYVVLRFTWEDLTRRPDQVAATIRTTLAGLRAVQRAS